MITSSNPVPEIISIDIGENDYVISIKRPNGTILRVLIPRDDLPSIENDCINQSEDTFGLNMVFNGHYT